ncbi:MAG TPA: transcriptional regulator [Calditrichaeota bacterium]|nr:transcriptional regulator [Calditrichota bacterium]
MANNFDEIVSVLAQTDNTDTIAEIMRALLSPAEINDIEARWEIVKRLERGISQRQIAKDLHLSLCKITRGSKELKKNAVLKNIVHNITSKEDNT